MWQQMQRQVVVVVLGITALSTMLLYADRYHPHRSSYLPTYLLENLGSSAFSRPPTYMHDIFNKTLGFERIYVLNLPSRTDRKDAFVLAAAVSNMEIEFINGVDGATVAQKVLPPGAVKAGKKTVNGKTLTDSAIGAWRTHMNALQVIVSENISTALIFEDDIDWDIRLRSQLYDLAFSVHALTQPLLPYEAGLYADPTFPSPKNESEHPYTDFNFYRLPHTLPPTYSPYGDNWDVLWLGHCGMRYPDSLNNKSQVPTGRIIQENDHTVPEKRYLRNRHLLEDFKYPNLEMFKDHTRVTSHSTEAVCSLGYAVTQAGARRILHQVGLIELDAPFDIALRQFCEGLEGRTAHVCLTTQPPLFEHHQPRGLSSKQSDIDDHGAAFIETAHTDNIRWSTKLNSDILLQPPWKGEKIWWESYPDTDQTSTARK